MTQSKNGTTILKCSVKGVKNSTGKAAVFNPENNPYFDKYSYRIPCRTHGGHYTYQWKNTVSKSGNSTLTCIFKN